MKKAFDQTVRDLKREVNKTVLKIPKVEQKVLDATSNEPWGPHGSLLADIAQATRNYHEYQMIMGVIWKRINDTGKNWRHVYKGLTVLEYLVANGSERVIDDIREHAYQISTLSDFQYIDSSGRDQGNNVRRKSQNLVSLVNDKERITEVRQKAAANRDKFRSTSSMGGMYRPNSYSSMGGSDDRFGGRYGSHDLDRNVDSYGKEKEYGFRDDDRYDRNGDSYGRDVDRYGRDYEERYDRDGYRDADFRGRSQSFDEFQFGSRSKSSERYRQRSFDDDGQSSSRNSGARTDEQFQDGSRGISRKFSEQNISAPPSYEEAVVESGSTMRSQRELVRKFSEQNISDSPSYQEAMGESGSTVHNQRDVETSATTASRSFPPPISSAPSQRTSHGTAQSLPNQEVDGFDEFDPRGSVSGIEAAPRASNSSETNVLDSLAIVPVTMLTSTTDSELHVESSSGVGSTLATSKAAAPYTPNPIFEDPFGDSPFKADSSSDVQDQTFVSRSDPSQSTVNYAPEVPNFPPGESFSVQSQTNSHQNIHVLAELLPPSGTLPAVVSEPAFTNGTPSHPTFPALPGLPPQPDANNFGNMAPTSFKNPTGGPSSQFSSGMFIPQGGSSAHVSSYMAAAPTAEINIRPNDIGSSPNGSLAPTSSHVTHQNVTGPPAQLARGMFNMPQGHPPNQAPVYSSVQPNTDLLGSFLPETGHNASMASQQFPSASLASNNKFETKSTVWADTLSRGLVNLNISGPKTNPLADIGVDFEALNRKEKRMEKPSAAPPVSTINMGKAMGSGSGIGRAGASGLRPPPNAMMGPGTGMGMGMGSNPNVGMGMRSYGGMNQPMMGGGMGMNMGMGMGMGMGQGFQMQLQPGPNMPGVYNPMTGTGNYAPQQRPYGGYR